MKKLLGCILLQVFVVMFFGILPMTYFWGDIMPEGKDAFELACFFIYLITGAASCVAGLIIVTE